MHSGIESLSTYCRHSQTETDSNVFAERRKRKPSERRRPQELRRRNFKIGENITLLNPITAVQKDSTTKATMSQFYIHPHFYFMSRHFEPRSESWSPLSTGPQLPPAQSIRAMHQCTLWTSLKLNSITKFLNNLNFLWTSPHNSNGTENTR